MASPNERLVCAIMAGGSGTRFWPLSRRDRPKQLLNLLGDASLLRATIDRIAPLCRPDRTLIITAERLREAVHQDASELPAANIIAEPAPRNTAPCLALAAIAAMRIDPDAILCLLPADHHVADGAAFCTALATAAKHADNGRIVTLGITPTRPETGFGYIQTGAALADGTRQVTRFVEKPDLATAMGYVTGGQHLWNGGIFALRADIAWQAMRDHQPKTWAQLEPLIAADAPAPGTEAFTALLAKRFVGCPAVSIDYGIMEHRDDLLCVPLTAGWSDVGTWPSLLDHREGAGNFERGDVIALDTKGCVLVSDGPTIAAIGLDDITIVATGDAVLAMRNDRSQHVRTIVDTLQKADKKELL